MTSFFQIYHNSAPELNEIVLIKFTKKCNTHFEGELIDYNYNAIMSYNDATKKKKVYSWNKIIPLNKIMLAKIENVIEESSIVQVSTAYNNKDTKEEMKQFLDNKILIALIKKICNSYKLNFIEFWESIIHPIDKKRKMLNIDNLYNFFKDNLDLLSELINNKYENSKEIINFINNNIKDSTFKIKSKIGLISINGLKTTLNIISEITKTQEWDYQFKYDTTPYYILESNSNNSSLENHEDFINNLNSLATQNKIFTKIEYIGSIC
jgi:hypothetical protein